MPINRTPSRFLAFLKRVAWMQRSGIQGSFEIPDSVALHPGYSFVGIGCLLGVLAGCSGSVIAEDEAPATPAVIQPGQKTLEDGQVLTRHAGDEWSRQKIREYLTKNSLNLNPRRSMQIEECNTMQPDLQRLNFEFIEPDVVTDDWDDPALDQYKQKYESFKYGMGYLVNAPPEAAAIPRWNITVYDLDTDNDADVEAILYGERLTISGLGNPPPGYLVFEANAEWQRGGGLTGDPAHRNHQPDDYLISALINVQNIYAVLAVYDWNILFPEYHVVLYLLGKQDKHRREAAYNSYDCYYDLKTLDESNQ